jgi:hypothetical protein
MEKKADDAPKGEEDEDRLWTLGRARKERKVKVIIIRN